MTRFLFIFFLVILPGWSQTDGSDPDLRKRGALILKEILGKKWASSWKGATLKNIRPVSQKPDLAQPTGLPPVWHAGIEGPDGKSGYLMWDGVGEGRLVEFALDDKLPVEGAIQGLPTLQQFPVPDPQGEPMASGCVPTSAASVVMHWMLQQQSEQPTPRDLTLALRKRLDMIRFPDTDGFTENGMALAGALPHKMAEALNAEAKARQLPIAARILPFSMERYREEIKAGRPTLLSCTVRVPHKPQLSWGHAVAGIANTRVDEVDLVGLHDNFYPTRHPETIRWIRGDAFRSLTVIQPAGE